MRRVWHVGVLDPDLRGHQHGVSYEGAGLSVSNCPAAWRSIASLDGPIQRLDRAGALWIDLAALGPGIRAMAVAHGVDMGLAEERHVWRSWIWEDGRDAWHSRPFLTEDEARGFTLGHSDTGVWPRPKTLEGHLAALPPEALPLPCPGLWEAVSMPLLTEAGNARALGFGRMVDATDMLVAFWGEDVLREANADIVGTWWRERLDVSADLAPRGAVFPGAIREMTPTRVRAAPRLVAEPDPSWEDLVLPGLADRRP
jgi:hypothetical protein